MSGTSRRGRGRREAAQFYLRFCFPDSATADAFRDRFGGARLTHWPAKRQRAAAPTYEPRIFDGRVMLPNEIERIHRETSQKRHLRKLIFAFMRI
jgi:hypothetical protein